MRAQRIIIVFFFLILFSAYAIWRYDLRLPQPPPIVLIELDSLRPDHLGCYGYHRPTSPNIDALAKKATRYTNCFSPATWTVPANYSLITSLYPQQHQMNAIRNVLDVRIPSLISFLKKENYTIYIRGNHTYFLEHLRENLSLSLEECASQVTAAESTHAVKQWIATRSNNFFVWIYYYEPHRPYAPPAPHNNLFSYADTGNIPVGESDSYYFDGWDAIPPSIVQNNIRNPQYYISQYDGAIHCADTLIGEIIATLKEKNLFDDCLILLLADHGESLGEHHLFFNHTWTFFNEIIKIPLLIKWPHQTKFRVIHSPASLIDIFPTIARAIRTKIPFKLNGKPLQLNNNDSRQLLCYNIAIGTCIIAPPWKLVRYNLHDRYTHKACLYFSPEVQQNNNQLLNLVQDPEELVNLTSQHPAQAHHLMNQLESFETQLKAHAFPSHKRPVPSADMQKTLKSRIRTIDTAALRPRIHTLCIPRCSC